MLFFIGVCGIAGAIETGHNPRCAIILTIIGALLMWYEALKDRDEIVREDSRPRFLK